ncbi:hypothetical protein JST97_36495 [bacterium]|nr:hypothetical protein [bacterium]
MNATINANHKTIPSGSVPARPADSGQQSRLEQIQDFWKEDGWVYAAGAGLYAGVGGAVGSLVGAPLTGVAKGLEVFALQAGSDRIMNTETFERHVFNWSDTMPACEGTPRDLDYDDPKTKALFYSNLATNVAVILSVPAAVGAILFGPAGALAVGALTLAAAPLAPLMR